MQADSFTQIYQSYFDPVYRYALSSRAARILPKKLRRRLFQGIAIPESISRQEQPESWLCAIAKNLWLSEQRKRKDQPIDDAMHLSDPSAGPEEARLCGRMSICASTGFSIT